MADLDLYSTLSLGVILGPLFDSGVGDFDAAIGMFDNGGEVSEVVVAKTGAVVVGVSLSSSFVLEGFLQRALMLNVATDEVLYNFIESTRTVELACTLSSVVSGYGETTSSLGFSVGLDLTKDLLSRSSRELALDIGWSLGNQKWGDEDYAEPNDIYEDVAPVEVDPFTDVGTAP